MNTQLAATTAAGAFSFFMPIAKIDKAKRTVSGYASTPSIDSDGEIVSLKAVKDALPGYMQYGNIREMHKISAVGVAKEANIDEKGLYLTAKIVDDAAWNKCVEGVYKGFSIGGQKLLKSGNTITKIDMAEISVVDRPANPDCKIDVIKMAKPVENPEAVLVKVKPVRSAEATATLAMAKAVKNLIKSNEDPIKPAQTENTSIPESVATLGKGKEGEPEVPPPSPKAKIKKAKKEARQRGENQIGKTVKVKYRDRMAKAFAELETLDLPQRSAEPAGPQASAPVFLDITKVATGDLSVDHTPAFLNLGKSLKKGMGAASSLTYAFGSIREAQRSLMLEGRDEKDGKDQGLAKRLGSIAKELAGVIGDKALHEGDEAVTMTDVDDKWVNQSLGKAKKMSANNNVKQMVRDAVLETLFGGEGAGSLAKAEKPDMKACLKGVKDNMKEAKKARKSSMENIEKAHSLLKTNYLAKAAKKPEDKDPEFDSAECMKALSGAYANMQKAATFEKAAKEFLAKADSMSSQSPTSGNADYVVPAGVKTLSQSDLAEGGPPPLYESTTVYPGKAAGAGDLKKFANKEGLVSLEVAELIARNSALEGQVETLGNMPRGRRPYGFDVRKTNGGYEGAREAGEARNIIFEGVDVGAIGSGNEELHKAASARAVGNLILAPSLGRSIFDPNFKGTAGVKH